MGRKRVEYGEEAKAQIIAEQKKSHPAHVCRRLLALKLKVVDGMTNKEVGKIAGLHETSVNRMMGRYRKEGMEAIVGVRHHHEHRYMSRAEEEAFLKQFQLQSEAAQIIETRELHRAYEQAVGHQVTRSMIYYLLHRHKWRKVMPRSRHEKQASPEAVEAYKKKSSNM